jgi:hypothetical protein
MAVEDPALKGHLANAHYLEIALPILGALIVVIVGKMLAARHSAAAPAAEG